MNDSNNNPGNTPSKRKWLFPLGVAAIAISSIVVVSCFHDDDSTSTTFFDDGSGGVDTPPIVEDPAPISVTGTGLACDAVAPKSTVASTLKVELPDAIQAMNISFEENTGDANNPGSWNNHNAANNLKRLSTVIDPQDPLGEPVEVLDRDGNPVQVHPLIVSYGEQVIGGYEGGDGSADIGDPDNIDDIFTSLSLDNGKSWKKFKVGDTADRPASSTVIWDGQSRAYPGHSHKPTMQVEGNNILVAWNDKHCPNGNPFDLDLDADPNADKYKVNGNQGSIDYDLDGSTPDLLAPNGKELYEVPFSCVWTARGELVLDPEDVDGTAYTIQWRQAQQLTSGTRDSNKIWIASFYDAAADKGGFALTWQEDPVGLRPGKGEGPGEGYSGATTNHGADIWYTHIDMEFFDDICADPTDQDCTTAVEDPTPTDILNLGQKPKPAVNFAYPVRITNNEICKYGTNPDGTTVDEKVYCAEVCAGKVSITSNNASGETKDVCYQNDVDYMTYNEPAAAVLDGDTGASRPALNILVTNADPREYVAVLAYEETKGLSLSTTADQGETETDIALEGKAVYLETFIWDDPVTVSAGNLVNTLVPRGALDEDGNATGEGDVNDMIYENARRVVILGQVDACEMQDGDHTFALLYKQGYETQGGSSDMFIRVNTGFTHETFAQLDGRDVTNVSSHGNTNDPYVPSAGVGAVLWDPAVDLDSQSYTYPGDNTFSPRGWLRGGEVYTGFEYSPLWRATEVGTVPNNFWIHRYVDNAWQGPVQLSLVTNPDGDKISTLDPRFIPTPMGSDSGLASDQSNPDVIFLGYGTFDMTSGDELDLYYMRSTDKGATWEYLDDGDPASLVVTGAGDDRMPGTADDTVPGAKRLAKLAARPKPVHEMELQGLASPDGTMFFGAWLREMPTVDNIHQDGMESEFGRVDYDTEVVVAP